MWILGLYSGIDIGIKYMYIFLYWNRWYISIEFGIVVTLVWLPYDHCFIYLCSLCPGHFQINTAPPSTPSDTTSSSTPATSTEPTALELETIILYGGAGLLAVLCLVLIIVLVILCCWMKCKKNDVYITKTSNGYDNELKFVQKIWQLVYNSKVIWCYNFRVVFLNIVLCFLLTWEIIYFVSFQEM